MSLALLPRLVLFLLCFACLNARNIQAQNTAANLGSVDVGSSASAAVTLTVYTAATLGSISVRFMGAENLDFTNAGGGSCTAKTSYAVNASCTVKVTFKPLHSGQRRGAVVLLDPSGNVIGTAYIVGTGISPEASILTGSGVLTGIPRTLSGFAVDGADAVWTNLFVSESVTNAGFWKTVNGTYVQQTGIPFNDAGGIALDGAGYVYTDNNVNPTRYVPAATGGGDQGSGFENQSCASVGSPSFVGTYFATDDSGDASVSGFRGFEETSFTSGTCSVSYPLPSVLDGSPGGMALDPFGNLYFAFGQLYKVSLQQGTSTSLLAGSSGWYDVVSDGLGNLYLSNGAGPDYNLGGTETTYIALLQSNGTYDVYPVARYHVGPLAIDGNGNLFIDGGLYQFDLQNPSPVGFGQVSSGQVGYYQTGFGTAMTVVNTGNQPLKITSVIYPADFPETRGVTGDCAAGQTIAVGSACTISTLFSPVASLDGAESKTLNEEIKLVSNSLNGSATEQIIPVSGTELLPAPSVTIIASANPVPTGSSVTFTAKVAGPGGSPIPTGSVTFVADTTTIGTVTLNGGQASVATSNLNDGSHTIYANYSGDTNYSVSTSVLFETIYGSATEILLSGYGQTAAVGVAFASPLTVEVRDDAGDDVPGAVVNLTSTDVKLSSNSITTGADGMASVTGTPEAVGELTVTATVSGTSYQNTFNLTGTGIPSYQYIPITPCRVADTRSATGAFGAPEIAANQTRTFDIPQSACAIPSTATAYALNVTVVPTASLNYLTVWPAGVVQPNVSTLNSDGRVKANAAIVPAGASGGVSIYASNATQVILDINGYFVPAGSVSTELAFYPVTPCRIADTRGATGPEGGPSIATNANRSFPIASTTANNCGIPSTATAYSLNITAVPNTTLNYLTAWPTGVARPGSSTLNSSTGAVAANAAIIPAGTGGDVSVYVSDASDIILDINGYFAPQKTGGLALYTVTPCRVIDTRASSGAFSGILAVDVASSSCAPPATAQAYVLNATVVPPAALDYISLWAAGESQPYVSTLNAIDGAITSNMAIVPIATTGGSAGTVDSYASNPTNLILDISSYFAPANSETPSVAAQPAR